MNLWPKSLYFSSCFFPTKKTWIVFPNSGLWHATRIWSFGPLSRDFPFSRWIKVLCFGKISKESSRPVACCETVPAMLLAWLVKAASRSLLEKPPNLLQFLEKICGPEKKSKKHRGRQLIEVVGAVIKAGWPWTQHVATQEKGCLKRIFTPYWIHNYIKNY